MKIFFLVMLISCSLTISAQKELPLYSIAPDITSKDQYGKKIQLKNELKNGPVIIVFYRGEWCPHCNRYMHNFADSIGLIHDYGARVIAITPESNESVKKTMSKTDVTFSIIYDKGHKIMDDYQVTFRLSWCLNLLYNLAGININKAGGNKDRVLPVPATYIIDQSGRIIGSHFNEDYTIRMSVSEIINILNDKHKLQPKH